MNEERFVDVPFNPGKPTARDGIEGALRRAARSANVPLNHVPQNRAEARRMMKGAGPHMRFKYEVDDEGKRRGVRVRV